VAAFTELWACGIRDHERGEFAVTESGKDRRDAGQDEGKNNCRPRILRGNRPGEDKDPRADNRANAERG